MKRLVLAAVVALGVLPLFAQEEEEVEPSPAPIFATLVRDSRLHTSPGGASKGTVKAGTEVRVVGTTEGWMRVRAGQRTGWVDRRFLEAKDEAMSFAPKAFTRTKKSSKHPPCADDLEHCLAIGCATGDSDAEKEHALFNTIKHGPGSEPPARLTLASFGTLQTRAAALVGEGAELTSDERESIGKLKVGSVTTGEGHLASVTGFIVGKPHPNTGESVNCNRTEPENNDIHINVAPSAASTPFESIVVETIPQGRNPGWTKAKLAKVEKAKQRVMVTGQLFYDNAHRVRKNASTPGLTSEPQRFSLWEVHPISEFLVCTKKTACSPTVKSQWTKLEDIPD
jgi:SH3 domain-containing protein